MQHHFLTISIPSFRGLFIIDKSGVLRQITVNDLPVGRDVDETLRLVQVNTGKDLDDWQGRLAWILLF